MADGENEGIEPYRIRNAPPSMFYIPNFITVGEEEYILNKVRSPFPVEGEFTIAESYPDPAEQMDLTLSPPSTSHSCSPHSVKRSRRFQWSSRLAFKTNRGTIRKTRDLQRLSARNSKSLLDRKSISKRELYVVILTIIRL